MQREAPPLTESLISPQQLSRPGLEVKAFSWLVVVGIGVVLLLALANLTDYPTPWFDEGSHLHVPKTLVRFGVYADYSSEGFRHYGPTIGVGPTVMLPLAAAFQLFGIGLLQARLVMVLFLLGTIVLFYRLTYQLGGRWLAWVGTALLVVTPGVALVEFGRQVLGEVPGLFFVVAGLTLWFKEWPAAKWGRLALVGVLLGLAMVTKHQYLLLLAPALGMAWIANLVYYRSAPQRTFLVPGIISATCFALWQVYLIVYVGPGTAQENLAMFREFTSGAALVFSLELMQRGLSELMSLKVYLGMLLPALIYGLFLALPRRREGQVWGILLLLVGGNLVWYVVASIGWLRYAFPGLVFSAVFVAKFFIDLLAWLHTSAPKNPPIGWKPILRWGWLAWLVVLIVLPLGVTARKVLFPEFNAPRAMSDYLNENVSETALIETWEPELGFLTDHNYHYPPPLLLNNAVGHIWQGGPSPAAEYDFVQTEQPDYVLVGEFSRWVQLYPVDFLAEHYTLVTSIGAYDLYQRN